MAQRSSIRNTQPVSTQQVSPSPWFLVALACALVICAPGCSLVLPHVQYQPQVHNPFPQLSRVAVAPFFNQSDEATLNVRDVAMSYYGQLQAVPGFEVVPLGVVEQAIVHNRVNLSNPGEARRLAKILGVDAVVVGSVTDYMPWNPQRFGLRVEWYAANPGFHEIPPGYGLPWGTPEEEFIPPPLVYEAELSLAKAQLATQTPNCGEGEAEFLPVPELNSGPAVRGPKWQVHSQPESSREKQVPVQEPEALPPAPGEERPIQQENKPVSHEEEVLAAGYGSTLEPIPASGIPCTNAPNAMLPPDWPDERGFIPDKPSAVRPPCIVNMGPVMTHTRIYHADDPDFTEALCAYVEFREGDRFEGWQSYLQRSDDFIRFCCHLHISEMLSARGGAGETRVVCEWPSDR